MVHVPLVPGDRCLPDRCHPINASIKRSCRGRQIDFRSYGTLVIENFRNGDLGIYLDETESDDPQARPPSEDRPDGPSTTGMPEGSGARFRPRYNPDNSRRRMDPLALDLDGDGRIATVSSGDSAAYFDYNGDGIGERSGWIDVGDGLLALDGNGNGVVDGLTELFGTSEQDGFGELATHDSNNDGVIDAGDADYGRLLVWYDADGDGIAENGELAGLGEIGIERIGLDATPVLIEDGDNRLTATARYQRRRADGSGVEAAA